MGQCILTFLRTTIRQAIPNSQATYKLTSAVTLAPNSRLIRITTNGPVCSHLSTVPHTILPAEAYASEFSPVSSSSSSPSPSYVTGHRSSSSPSMGVSQDPQRGGGEVKRCSHCQATSTPLWRREPSTQKPLCNACGLYLQQRNKLRPQELIDADADDDESPDIMENPTGPECSHCHTRQTSVWRRSKTGEQLCNACGVYIRLRGVERPLSLKRKKIKPRSKHSPK